jgi:hypothetical protein
MAQIGDNENEEGGPLAPKAGRRAKVKETTIENRARVGARPSLQSFGEEREYYLDLPKIIRRIRRLLERERRPPGCWATKNALKRLDPRSGSLFAKVHG